MAGSVPELPFELWSSISSHLTNRDIKSMRLVCKQIHNAARLRLDRVFLSANPLNIEVFRAIADHDTFRHTVTEIIWDDARFSKRPRRDIRAPGWDDEVITDDEKSDNEPEVAPDWSDEDEDESDEDIGEYPGPRRGKNDECPRWFRLACRENLELLRERDDRYDVDDNEEEEEDDDDDDDSDADRPDHSTRKQIAAQPPLKDCWKYYQHLLLQQANVLATNADEDTFVYGLKQFSTLKKVTVTPVAHGFLFSPLYLSPMIRAFPKGFNYPIPRSWPMPPLYNTELPPLAYPWRNLDEKHKDKYRGFRITTRILAKENHNISEFIIDVNHLPTGLNCTMLDHPCEEYDNIAMVLKHPGLRRLDLSFIVRGIEREDVDWRSFRNGRLHQALSEASEIEDVRLYTAVKARKPYGAGPIRHLVPLQSIFPVERWSRLRHFELSRFLVVQTDVISLLSALPKTLRSAHLSNLQFLDNGGTWYGLLTKMRKLTSENILWPEREGTSRPKLTIFYSDYIALYGGRTFGRGIRLEKEVHDYLFRDGENPFEISPWIGVKRGFGIKRDAFETDYARVR